MSFQFFDHIPNNGKLEKVFTKILMIYLPIGKEKNYVLSIIIIIIE